MSLTNIERDLERLEAELKVLEAEYTMYFAGRLSKPPVDTRRRVDATVRRIDRTPMQNTAIRFRFATIQSRYAAFAELWERGMRAREEGRAGPFTPSSDQRPVSDDDRGSRPGDRVVHVATVHDGRDESTLDALYESLAIARREVGAVEVPFQRFAKVVTSELERLHAQGSADVVFRVTIKDGKAHLTARSHRAPTEASTPSDDAERTGAGKEATRKG